MQLIQIIFDVGVTLDSAVIANSANTWVKYGGVYTCEACILGYICIHVCTNQKKHRSGGPNIHTGGRCLWKHNN